MIVSKSIRRTRGKGRKIKSVHCRGYSILHKRCILVKQIAKEPAAVVCSRCGYRCSYGNILL